MTNAEEPPAIELMVRHQFRTGRAAWTQTNDTDKKVRTFSRPGRDRDRKNSSEQFLPRKGCLLVSSAVEMEVVN